MSNHKINEEIKRVKAKYNEGQVERRVTTLSARRRKKLATLQLERVKRLKHLGGLLTQRVIWN